MALLPCTTVRCWAALLWALAYSQVARTQRTVKESYVFVGTYETSGSIVRYTLTSATNATIVQTAEYMTAGSPAFLAIDNATESMYVLHNFGPATWGRLSYYGISHYGDLYLGGFVSTYGSMPKQANVCADVSR